MVFLDCVVPFWCFSLLFLPFYYRKGSKPIYTIHTVLCCVLIVYVAVSIGITYAYYIYVPVKKLNGATLGKRAMRLKVVKEDDSQLTQVDMFLREFIGKFVSAMVFWLGYIWIFIDERGQGWHDKIARTLVVVEE